MSLPVVVRARDGNGEPLECGGRTVSINRHGGGIEIDRSLEPNQVLKLVNPASHRDAEFRLVGRLSAPVAGAASVPPRSPGEQGAGVYAVLGPLTPGTTGGQEYGVQCVDTKIAFWGISFPPVSPDSAEPQVSLECLRCRKVQGLRLSIVETDVLESAGCLPWPCEACREVTSWGYREIEGAHLASEPRVSSSGPLGLAGSPGPAAVAKDASRSPSRLPIKIRRSSGQVELLESREVSRTGFLFSSEVDYEIGEAVFVVCPESPAGANAEAPAQIARKQEVRGTGRKIFGVRYVSTGS